MTVVAAFLAKVSSSGSAKGKNLPVYDITEVQLSQDLGGARSSGWFFGGQLRSDTTDGINLNRTPGRLRYEGRPRVM